MKDAVEFDAPRRGPRELHEKQESYVDGVLTIGMDRKGIPSPG